MKLVHRITSRTLWALSWTILSSACGGGSDAAGDDDVGSATGGDSTSTVGTAGTRNSGGGVGAGTGGIVSGMGGQAGNGGSPGTGGGGGKGGTNSPGGAAGSVVGAAGAGDAGISGPMGVWQDVTPSGITLDRTAFGSNNFGVMDVVADPVRKSDLYAFTCYQGVWRSTDYGSSFIKVSAAGSKLETGRQWAAAIDNDAKRDPTKAPALYTANGYGSPSGLFKSTDWGVTWVQASNPGDVYSIDMDPYDHMHLIIGFHEAPGIAESNDGGTTWKQIPTQGTGNSIYPFFVDTGNATTTRTTWLAIPQDFVGGNTYRTTNAGGAWTQVSTFVHPHGTCQIFNAGAGVVYAGLTHGVHQSKDYGVTWTQVSMPDEAAVIGTPKFLYASSGVNFSPGPPADRAAPRTPGTVWSDMTVPPTLVHGAKRLAVTDDGSHYVVVQGSWMSGIWRYVEP